MKKACLILLGLFVFAVFVSTALYFLTKAIPIGSKIALIRVEGPILDARQCIDELKKYTEDASVKAIVLRVDSPGGAVAPSQEIYDEVKKAVAQKDVVVSMGSMAASGGYYISAPATRIVANPGTLTGSIGVIMEIPNIEGLMDKIGVKTEVIKSGAHKDIASAFRQMSDEERAILQNVLDDVHSQFINAVAAGRGIPEEEVRMIADGRIFTGRQAIDVKLVDELGNIEDAIDIAADLAGIEGEPSVVTSRKRNLGLLDLLDQKFSGSVANIVPSLSLKYQYVP